MGDRANGAPTTTPELTEIENTNASTSPTSRNFSSVARAVSIGNSMTALPSVDDLQKQSHNLFEKIKSGDHEGVERLLSERGHKVDIVPRIGCSSLHYSRFNMANWETETGDNPLILAARVDSRMVKIVLMYGGNPNHTNKERDTPLSIAAGRSDKEAIDALLLAGANLRAAVVKLTSLLKYVASDEQLKGYGDVACSVKPLTVLLSDDVYLKCRCPIKTAFDVGRDIANIKDVRSEFKTEFELLIEDANVFANRFMNNIDRMWEAREILTYPVDLIRMAIDQKKKKFVSHPFSQQIIYDRWFGDLAHKMFYGKLLVTLKFLFSPFLVLPLMLKFCLLDVCRGQPVMKSDVAELLRLKFTPCLCFITDAVNYLILHVILIFVCLTEQDTGKVTPLEYALYVCVISRIFIELDLGVQQGWRRYFANVWNYVDILILILLSIAALYKGCIDGELHVAVSYDDIIKKYEEELDTTEYNLEEWSHSIGHYRHFLNISYIYAVTEFVLFLRILTLLEYTRSLGPMLIALKYLLADVLKFTVVLMTTVVGTSITIYSMSVRLEKWNLDINEKCGKFNETDKTTDEWKSLISFIDDMTAKVQVNSITDNSKNLCDGGDITIEPPASFGSFLATLRSIMWSTFGLFDVQNVTKPYEESTISFINVILVLYILLACVLLLNMLIGILSSTFDRIQENCDVEWKYARSELLKEYSRGQPFLIPFSTLLFPLVYWFREKMRQEKQKESEKFPTQAAEQAERDKIISEVCERFKTDYTDYSEEDCATRPRTARPGTKPGTAPVSVLNDFDARVRQMRTRKPNIEFSDHY